MIGLLLIALGGALGSVLRFGVITLTYKFFDIHFPWGTIFANLTGCFVIGVIWAILDTFDEPKNLKLFLITGLLGGFTTFSSFALENFNMLRAGEIKLVAANVLISNIAGIFLVFIGYYLTKQFLQYSK
ncbi:MAG: fluoride efflux transporter CrcB [bacterium]